MTTLYRGTTNRVTRRDRTAPRSRCPFHDGSVARAPRKTGPVPMTTRKGLGAGHIYPGLQYRTAENQAVWLSVPPGKRELEYDQISRRSAKVRKIRAELNMTSDGALPSLISQWHRQIGPRWASDDFQGRAKLNWTFEVALAWRVGPAPTGPPADSSHWAPVPENATARCRHPNLVER